MFKMIVTLKIYKNWTKVLKSDFRVGSGGSRARRTRPDNPEIGLNFNFHIFLKAKNAEKIFLEIFKI